MKILLLKFIMIFFACFSGILFKSFAVYLVLNYFSIAITYVDTIILLILFEILFFNFAKVYNLP